jgi:hypothetical protein
LHPETGKVMGLTILDFSQRFGTVESLVKVPVVGEFVMALTGTQSRTMDCPQDNA